MVWGGFGFCDLLLWDVCCGGFCFVIELFIGWCGFIVGYFSFVVWVWFVIVLCLGVVCDCFVFWVWVGLVGWW